MSEIRKMKEYPYRAWLEIDLSAVKTNFEAIRESLSPLEVFAVVKADAYGTGADVVAEVLNDAGADGFAVSCMQEAYSVLKFGKPVQILGAVFDFELSEAVRNNVILAVPGMDTAKRISAEAVRQGKTVECHFKIDSGMGRFGMTPEEAVGLIPQIVKLPNLNCCGIFSHMPAAGDGENPANLVQLDKFLSVFNAMAELGIKFRHVHLSNSPAMNSCTFVRHAPFTRARIGLCLHGLYDDGPRTVRLTPSMSYRSRIASVRWMKKGSTLGYSRTCMLKEDTLVGLVSAGYADGIPLALSNKGTMLVRGKRCPVLGRIAMDYTAISLQSFASNPPEDQIRMGEVVTCLGSDGEDSILPYEWACFKETHPYEILCSITPRVHRVYVNHPNK